MGKKDEKPVVTTKEKLVKMRFPKDMYYSDPNVPLYSGGKVVDVPESKVDRWLKRGGVLIEDEVRGAAPIAPHVDPPPPEKTGEGETEK